MKISKSFDQHVNYNDSYNNYDSNNNMGVKIDNIQTMNNGNNNNNKSPFQTILYPSTNN